MIPIPSPSSPIYWVFDWDGTLTKRDTLDALVDIAAECKPDSSVLEQWKRVTEAYLDDYEKTLKLHAPDGQLPSTIAEEKALLAIMEEVEQRSLDRVSSSGIFKALTAADLSNGAEKAINSRKVQLRDGCHDFFQNLGGIGNKPSICNILSVNWSQHFIVACLTATHVDKDHASQRLIYANELEGIALGRPSSGRIGPGSDRMIISSRSKLATLQNLRTSNSHTRTKIPVVYVGDSWTDFECLLAADLGICIRDDPMTSTQKKLSDSLERVGVRCPHLQNTNQADEWRVVWARDFYEISKWMQNTP